MSSFLFAVCTVHGPIHQPGHSVLVSSFFVLFCSLYCTWTYTTTRTFCFSVKFFCFVLQSVLYMDLYTNQDILFKCQVFCFVLFAVCALHGPIHQPGRSVPMSSIGGQHLGGSTAESDITQLPLFPECDHHYHHHHHHHHHPSHQHTYVV